MQTEEWSEVDVTFKRHKSKLEMAKEQAAAARYSRGHHDCLPDVIAEACKAKNNWSQLSLG